MLASDLSAEPNENDGAADGADGAAPPNLKTSPEEEDGFTGVGTAELPKEKFLAG